MIILPEDCSSPKIPAAQVTSAVLKALSSAQTLVQATAISPWIVPLEALEPFRYRAFALLLAATVCSM